MRTAGSIMLLSRDFHGTLPDFHLTKMLKSIARNKKSPGQLNRPGLLRASGRFVALSLPEYCWEGLTHGILTNEVTQRIRINLF